MGGVTGGSWEGVTGGMKFAESLYLKGSAPSDGRDGALPFESQQKSGHEIKLFDVHQQEALNFQHAILSKMLLTGNRIFPSWESIEDRKNTTSFWCFPRQQGQVTVSPNR